MPQFSWKASSCRFTSCREVVFCTKSYVDGKRKPSSWRRLWSPANLPGIFELAVAARYALGESFGLIFRFCRAIWFTALIRSAIWARVKPSGKMIFRVGGATIGVGLRLRLARCRGSRRRLRSRPAPRTRGPRPGGPAQPFASPGSGRATARAGARAAGAPALRARAARPRQVARQQMGRCSGVGRMRSAALLGEVGRETFVEALHGHAQSFAQA